MSSAPMEISKVWARGAAEGFTPYMVARIVNEALKENGLEQIIPQMMYNYDRNGLINGTKAQNQQRGYTTEEVIKFVEKFVAMRIAKGRKVQTTEPLTIEQINVELDRLQALKAELEEQQAELTGDENESSESDQNVEA